MKLVTFETGALAFSASSFMAFGIWMGRRVAERLAIASGPARVAVIAFVALAATAGLLYVSVRIGRRASARRGS